MSPGDDQRDGSAHGSRLQKVATLKDDTGQVVASSKFIEIHFDKDGKVIRVGDQFGLGRL